MLKDELRDSVCRYVNSKEVKERLTVPSSQAIIVDDLAQGEYNLNYLLRVFDGDGKEKDKNRAYVFRVNTGSQMQLKDQIGYEYRALEILGDSGVTPRPIYLDGSKKDIPYGLLIMEYLPGRPLNYATDLKRAAYTFAKIHSIPVSDTDAAALVKEEYPFTAIYKEADCLLKTFFACERVDSELKEMFYRIMDWAYKAKEEEKYFRSDPWQCIINTEVNSHNFIVNEDRGITYLIDWEKPILGEPAQDLSHFLIRTTTLWKADYILSTEEEKYFLTEYLKGVPGSPLKSTLLERVEMFKPFIHLRAVSWCAMAWVEYTSPGRLLRNEDTFTKIKSYVEPNFIKELFPNIKFK
ncbi:MAG: hypothetical protein APF84_05395 [Gracilibacter sp. BRH_c7a]|nr:MAG: hypothetical protein APF84_05395 [Gracilibacter sp. BRH_c7a]